MSNTALYTTIYPGEELYLKPWFDSVAAQTDNDFDIVIGLDAFTPEQVFEHVGQEFEARFVSADAGATPVEVRTKPIELIINEYDQVVFTDSDDVLFPQRVERAKKQLQHCDLTACALEIINEDGSAAGQLFPLKENATLEELLPFANVFGLSNTAYRCELLRRVLPVPCECVMMDWFMATKAWFLGAEIYRDSAPMMSYRQHGSNTARVLAPFTEKQIINGFRLLKLHYSLLSDHVLADYPDKMELFRGADTRLDIFIDSMKDEAKLNTYLISLNKLEEEHIWWSWLAHPQLEEIWKN
ncbi:hypothetical protein [Maridesulfovibrio sp.]|uniref:hypothetical protein n=1 Tax=Maridesulfovibrio sp. TaxID=2795000 RepID=UPI002AA8177A|nr:hypothetical protein [Maridesulfovibrio sp.]